LIKEGNEIFILDKKGEDIRKAKISKNCVFIIGDHEGFPQKEIKRLKDYCKSVSIGKVMYFASQTVAVVNNELDYRGI
jgi:tRNA (pseudouridine54-N1)-methyltransferase